MHFSKAHNVLLLTSFIATYALANGQLTQEDLDNVQRSNDIISNAHEVEGTQAVLDASNLNPKMMKELKQMADHAKLLNSTISDQSDSLIEYRTDDTPDINFRALQDVIDDNQTQYQANSIVNEGQPKPLAFDPSTLTIDNLDSISIEQPNPSSPSQKVDNKYDDEEANTVFWIFVSSSMPDHQMKEVLELAAEWGGRVVFNGLRPGDVGVPDMIKGLWQLKVKLANAQDDIRTHAENPDKLKRINKAAVYMDPMAFERFNIEQVPTMVYERKLSDNTKLVGKVKGLISASYLQNETESAAANPDYDGSEVFLGEMGSIFPIAEKSFIEESKNRMRAVDWETEQKQAIARHWHNRSFHTLPPAAKDREFDFDPTVIATADVKAVNGLILAKKGELINPLKPLKNHDIVPAHLTMFIFDATDEQEVEFVKYMSLNESRGKVKLISTRIDKDRGFDHISELNKKFTYDVTILTKEVIDRFDLEVTPTRLISTDKGMFQINEYSAQTVTQVNLQVADGGQPTPFNQSKTN
ncbi:TrbC family F-type conjugative pilus assembly protein [Vibrio gigantis]|uniref:Conjugal transfer protein n=1 Tax=Vibrio gigantis TaxID=296199 RepID=A0A5M9NX28_9VIBR|nr:TrbC family F-type conjugative pilus assembly protein [Vibrio gigantis]KAA8675667.1 hypothetical protein F4W18_13675 [Vibrio gigantis]